ncbi:MAG: AmmeMemoRadiSam system protein A [Anaerolineales bacterium]|nr:AmmeMemoRadiSam system protein A [Anaerolineales bacterium]
MEEDKLSPEEQLLLLKIARRTIEEFFVEGKKPQIDLSDFSQSLIKEGATFVTLTKRGELRGCVGALEAYQPLIEDVRDHALAAAFDDYRFAPLRQEELPFVEIEISRLTPPKPIEYSDADDLLQKIRPDIDGVILRDRHRKATFLPQVWEKLPQADIFLSHLCQKMGCDPDIWRFRKLEVSTYQVEMFHE